MQLQASCEKQGQHLQVELQGIREEMTGLVTTGDFNNWSASMNQQVATFLQDGLAEMTKDLQLQLQGIRDECKAMVASALPAPERAGK